MSDCSHSLDLSHGCTHPFSLFLEDQEHSYPFNMIVGCGKRFELLCPECARKWRSRNYNRFRNAISNFQKPKFLTLTLKKDENGNCDRVRKLWQYRKDLFKNLKRAGFKIERWIAVIELPNHIHMVYDGSYMAQSRIQRVWRRLTGDSWFVNIKAVKFGRSESTMAHYLSKYMTKINGYDEATLAELKGFHLVNSCGLNLEKRTMDVVDESGERMGLNGWKLISENRYYCLLDDLIKEE